MGEGLMNKKNDILESWIMVEHLSEGDINLKDKAILNFNDLQRQDYYSLLADEIQKKGLKKNKHSGVIIYFDIFPFQEVIDFLREEYKLAPTEQEITSGNKFSFALCFDKELHFDEKKTFLTESYYIRKKKRIPKERDFRIFEEEMGCEFEKMFACPESKDYREHFNQVLVSILTKNKISIENCRLQLLKNMESDATNLHSFFIADLEKAKKIQTHNLDKYITGNVAGRRNLNCRKESEQFNPEIFYRILSPENYPIARFPSQYGFYKDLNQENWIGIPLWVHRRCKYPMFDISNVISYGGNMVQGDQKTGVAEWYDIKGRASDKYVAEQGKFLREKIQAMIMENPDIVDDPTKDIIYVISPFKNVAYQLSRELKKIGFTRYDKKGKPTNIGTVHTFQGKEAPIVFFVLGADEKCVGAANWAVGTENPNIMNVAATRAKNEFYIIGDKKLYLSLHSDVINGTYQIIEKYKRGTFMPDAVEKNVE